MKYPEQKSCSENKQISYGAYRKLEEIKSTLRKEIMSGLAKILAENPKEMLKLVAPVAKKQTALVVPDETDSEPENVPATATSTP